MQPSNPQRHDLRPWITVLAALAFTGALAASAHADTPRAAIAPQNALVAVGGASGPDDARVDQSRAVLFRNDGSASTRIVFARRSADGVDCATDGTRTTRSRPGQYLLKAGAELTCSLEPGRYRYHTYTQVDGAIQEDEARIRVQ